MCGPSSGLRTRPAIGLCAAAVATATHGAATQPTRGAVRPTVAQPLGLMGQVAAQRLFDRMAGTQIDDRSIVLEPELLTRGTTAPPRV
mgnify:CR=1 FL=1